MSIAKEKKAKNSTITADRTAVKPRHIVITKKIAESIRSVPTEGWVHIMPDNGKWRVRKHGADRALGIYNDKEIAISAAKKSIRPAGGVHIYVHDANGSVVQTLHA